MTRLFTLGAVLLLALGILAGCSNEARLAASNKAIVLRAVDAINNQQYESFDQFFAPDLKRHCQATPDLKINSLDEMIQFVRKWMTEFPDARMVTKLVVAEGDLVAWYGSFVGTNEAPMGDIPATGKKVDSETFTFFRLEDGKVAEMWVTWDNVALLNQLGLFPQPEPEVPGDEAP